MNKIFKIAKLEISILFYSPVAWLVLAIFTVQTGIGFFGMFQGLQEAISMGTHIDNLTYTVFPGLGGLFDKVTETLYLYIPLLSMGLMSRETASGSIKLLLSSPVKIREVIFGKYLAIIGYCLFLILILMGYALVGVVVIKNADVGLIISGLTGIFLLICTYAAIGLFMSSLTSYQVVAAISTLAVFATLRFVGNIGQDIDFVRDLTYFLSISGRADDMLKGLITTKDVLYFLIIIALFLSLCIARLQAGRQSATLLKLACKYMGLIGLSLLLGYVSSRPALIGYLDMTATASRSLTKSSQDVVKQIKGPLTITTYVNLLDENVYSGLPAARNSDMTMFEQYRRFIPGLKMEYVYYYDATDLKNNQNMIYQGDIKGLSTRQVAEKVADNMGLDINDFLPPSEIRKLIDLSSEDNDFVRVLSYQGKTSRLRIYNELNRFPQEAEITAAIKRLIVPAPKLVFKEGDNERSIEKKGDRNYQLFASMKKRRNALVNQGFDVVSIDLQKQNIPADAGVLVLADPAKPLAAAPLQKIKTFIAQGGNMLITTEPGRQQFVNPILSDIGAEVMEGTLVNPNKDESPDMIYARLTPGAGEEDAAFGYLQQARAFVALAGSAGIRYAPTITFSVDTLLSSPDSGWNKKGAADLAASDIKFNAAVGDEKGPFPVMLTFTRNLKGHQQKILVSGDADFISNSAVNQPKGYNMPFGMAVFKWFSNDKFPLEVSRPLPKDNALLLKRRQLSSVKLAFLGIVPGLIIVLGGLLLVSRKRK